MKLKQNKELLDFEQISESQYDSLMGCGMLIWSYPFCAGYSYELDREEYYRLLGEV